MTAKSLERLDRDVARLVAEIQEAEAQYAREKPRYDRARETAPGVSEKEVATIRAIGELRDDLQLARAERLHRQGRGPSPTRSLEIIDGQPPPSFRAAVAERSRKEVGRLDYTGES